jgi:hypothetical protein
METPMQGLLEIESNFKTYFSVGMKLIAKHEVRLIIPLSL